MNDPLRAVKLSSGQVIRLVQGDLTRARVDAIVNAANAYLQHGGGLAGAIVQTGGSEIQAESDRWVQEHGPVSHDRPAYTGAGRLPCRFVIHAVGPVWGSGDEDRKLAAAVRGSLQVAGELGLVSLAVPAISTGIFGFPKNRAAEVILDAIWAYFAEPIQSPLREVTVMLIDRPTLAAFELAWDRKAAA